MKSTLTIEGMSCQHCVHAVQTVLAAIPEVEKAQVTIGKAEVNHSQPLDEKALREALTEEGFELTSIA